MEESKKGKEVSVKKNNQLKERKQILLYCQKKLKADKRKIQQLECELMEKNIAVEEIQQKLQTVRTHYKSFEDKKEAFNKNIDYLYNTIIEKEKRIIELEKMVVEKERHISELNEKIDTTEEAYERVNKELIHTDKSQTRFWG